MSCQVCHRLLCQCGFGTQGVYDAELVATLTQQRDELLAALKECAERLRKCCIHSGSDGEYADQAVAKYRALIAKASRGAA